MAFFAGQAVGAALAARRVGRARRPLLVYAGLELAAALGALAVPLWIGWGEDVTAALYGALGDSPPALAALRFAIALLASLPTALCLGAALPALAAAALRDAGELGRAGAGLYAAHLLGGAIGTALAAFWLPERLGVSGAYAAALGLQVALAAVAGTRGRRLRTPVPQPAAPERPALAPERALLALAALSGFGAFAAQVLLIHAFAQVVNQSVYAFGAVLVVLFAALSLAALAVSRASRLDPRTLLGAALAAAAVGLALFPALLDRATGGFTYLGSEAPWPAYLVELLTTAALAAGPPLLAIGLVFPALLAVAGAGRPGSAGPPLARLLAANTLGAIAGALCAPFLLLPRVGPWSAFPLLAVAYAAAALAAPERGPRARLARAGGLLLALAVVLLLTRPLSLPLVRTAPGESLLFAAATPAGVVGVLEREGERLIRLDNHYGLGGSSERVREERQGHLPLLLQPQARRVVFLGSATGITAGAATAHPVREIALVEIAPGVHAVARRFFAAANRGVHGDPRARLVLDDARNYLRATRERFDVIVGDLFVPWRAGIGSLYAAEHFAHVRARLAEGGLFCQWLPLYQLDETTFRVIAATFLDAFPRSAVFRGDFFGDFPIAALVGWRDAPAPARAVSQAAARLAAAGERDRWIADPLGVWSLYAGPLAGAAPALAGVPRSRDDRPLIEFRAARAHGGGAHGVRDPFVGFAWVRFAEGLAGAGAADPLYPDLPAPARAAVRAGALLQRAGVLWLAGRADEAARALAAASALLPPRLVAEAPPDPTAANLWPR